MSKTLAVIRKDLRKQKLAVPVGNKAYGEKETYLSGTHQAFKCGWIKDLFVVKVSNKWLTASSIDFDFINVR